MLKSFALFSVAATAFVALAQPSQSKTRFSVDYLFDSMAPHPDSYFFDDEFDPELDVEDDTVYGRSRPSLYGDYDATYYEPEVAVQPPAKLKKKLVANPLAGAKKATPKLALAKPDLPAAPKKQIKKAGNATGVTCDKATQIVAGYGFTDVKVKSCSGNTYAFTGTRSGKTYEISVSAARGDLTEVKRI